MSGRKRSQLWAAVAGVALAAGLLAADDGAPQAATEPGPDLGRAARSVAVPFSRKVDFDHLRSMGVRVRVNGGPPITLQVDTGSVGVILGASDVPDIDPHAPAGEMVYSSSGYGLYGVWTAATIAFVDAAPGPDGRPVTAVVPVLAAREARVASTKAVNGKGFKPSKDPHPHMFGVGFGRGAEPHPERNPFVNLTEMRAGTMWRGYTITRDGFRLGLTAAEVGPDWRFQHLRERTVSAESARLAPGLKDWETGRGWVTVDGHRLADMPILVDTGLTNFFIPRPGLTDPADVPAGAAIGVHLLGGQLSYTFRVGQTDDPAAAGRTTYTVAKPTSNVNTGLRALADFDYLYDADGGYLGLRPTR